MDTECKRTNRERQCKGKIRHKTKAEAEIHLREQSRRSPWAIFDLYKCGWCHGWHIGNNPYKVKKRVCSYYKYLNK